MKKNLNLLALCAVLFLTLVQSAYASDGEGDGSGQGKGEPLTLTGTSIKDGIADGDMITLTFSNNVINSSVRENNKKAFILYDGDRGVVEIDVIMADEQIEPDAKRIISVRPVSGFSPGFEYTLFISKNIQAKNGAFAETDTEIRFFAPGPAPEETSAPAAVILPEAPSDDGDAAEEKVPEAGDGAPAASPALPAAREESRNPENNFANIPETENVPQSFADTGPRE
ncbi:MAG: Ig-like domain-containing protein, partial [Oscillospiraceae bacterium]|nr:Ig-like domain-containing protein [Oscillospiraceae bacterium]